MRGCGQPIGVKREPFPSLSHLPKGAVVLARPPDLHLGEIPPWKTEMDDDQKQRVTIFRFGVVSDLLPGTTGSVVNGRDYCGANAPSCGKSPFFIASGCRALPSWDGSGSTAKAAAS
ncbi:hypothetical protein DFAR_970014 [Desulfarculales bacterium]